MRRRPTSDLELQQALINLSTVFGIGISLLVEGVLILLVSIAAAPAGARWPPLKPAAPRAGARRARASTTVAA